MMAMYMRSRPVGGGMLDAPPPSIEACFQLGNPGGGQTDGEVSEDARL